MTAMTPVLHEDGTMAGYVMADISMNDVMNTRQTFLITLVALLSAVAVVFLVAFLVILRRMVVRPIDQLTQATGAFIQNNEDELAAGTATVNVPAIRTGDEVELLADSFRKMEEDMILLHPQLCGGHRGEGAHRRGAERGHPDPGGHAAPDLPRLPRAQGV